MPRVAEGNRGNWIPHWICHGVMDACWCCTLTLWLYSAIHIIKGTEKPSWPPYIFFYKICLSTSCRLDRRGERVTRERLGSFTEHPLWITELWQRIQYKLPWCKGIKEMNQLHKLINDPDQWFIYDYTFEVRLCGKKICNLCTFHQMKKMITTYEKIKRRVLNLMDMPAVEPYNKEKLILNKDAINMVYEVSSISEQLKSSPIIKEVDAEKKLTKESKSKYKVNLNIILHY